MLGDGDMGGSMGSELALGTRETKCMNFFGFAGIGGHLEVCLCIPFFGKDGVMHINTTACSESLREAGTCACCCEIFRETLGAWLHNAGA